MSCSRSKFLLDENVRIELYKFLKKEGVDVKLLPKGTANGDIAKFSLSEARVVVTNDDHFTKASTKEIFGVIWLKIPQEDPETLIKSFSLLLKSESLEFKSRLIILWPDRFKSFSLWQQFSGFKVRS